MVKKKNYYCKQLRENNFKLTPQRLRIIQILLELDHPTAPDILKELQQDFPNTQPQTLYRTLNVLEEIGELVPMTAFSPTKYELTSVAHPHFVCEETGEVKDAEGPEIESKLKQIKELVKKDVNKVELYIYHSCIDDISHGK